MHRKAASRLLGILATTVLAGCAGTDARKSHELPAQSADVRDAVAMLALSMIGVRYKYGGADPREGFDCSGLVYYAFTSNGLAAPRTSQEQFSAARKIPLAEAAAGDLLFFADQDRLSHVAIYVGEGRFVHAPSSGDSVRLASVDAPYYRRNLVAVGRLLP